MAGLNNTTKERRRREGTKKEHVHCKGHESQEGNDPPFQGNGPLERVVYIAEGIKFEVVAARRCCRWSRRISVGLGVAMARQGRVDIVVWAEQRLRFGVGHIHAGVCHDERRPASPIDVLDRGLEETERNWSGSKKTGWWRKSVGFWSRCLSRLQIFVAPRPAGSMPRKADRDSALFSFSF
jgi:hypothetical protein